MSNIRSPKHTKLNHELYISKRYTTLSTVDIFITTLLVFVLLSSESDGDGFCGDHAVATGGGYDEEHYDDVDEMIMMMMMMVMEVVVVAAAAAPAVLVVVVIVAMKMTIVVMMIIMILMINRILAKNMLVPADRRTLSNHNYKQKQKH